MDIEKIVNEWGGEDEKGSIILISGKAGVGKTTLANYIYNHFEGLKTISPFAKAVKDVAVYMSWNGEKDRKGRKLLQDIGRTGRDYNINVWVEKAFDLPFIFDLILVDDWRFPNELFYTKKTQSDLFDVYSVKVIAPNREVLSGQLANDISETALDNLKKFDFIVDNSGSFEELEMQAVKILKKIGGL